MTESSLQTDLGESKTTFTQTEDVGTASIGLQFDMVPRQESIGLQYDLIPETESVGVQCEMKTDVKEILPEQRNDIGVQKPDAHENEEAMVLPDKSETVNDTTSDILSPERSDDEKSIINVKASTIENIVETNEALAMERVHVKAKRADTSHEQCFSEQHTSDMNTEGLSIIYVNDEYIDKSGITSSKNADIKLDNATVKISDKNIPTPKPRTNTKKTNSKHVYNDTSENNNNNIICRNPEKQMDTKIKSGQSVKQSRNTIDSEDVLLTTKRVAIDQTKEEIPSQNMKIRTDRHDRILIGEKRGIKNKCDETTGRRRQETVKDKEAVKVNEVNDNSDEIQTHENGNGSKLSSPKEKDSNRICADEGMKTSYIWDGTKRCNAELDLGTPQIRISTAQTAYKDTKDDWRKKYKVHKNKVIKYSSEVCTAYLFRATQVGENQKDIKTDTFEDSENEAWIVSYIDPEFKQPVIVTEINDPNHCSVESNELCALWETQTNKKARQNLAEPPKRLVEKLLQEPVLSHSTFPWRNNMLLVRYNKCLECWEALPDCSCPDESRIR